MLFSFDFVEVSDIAEGDSLKFCCFWFFECKEKLVFDVREEFTLKPSL